MLFSGHFDLWKLVNYLIPIIRIKLIARKVSQRLTIKRALSRADTTQKRFLYLFQ